MSAEWFKFIEYPVHGVSQVFQFVVIAFLTTEFLRKKSDLQQAFYYILYISYIADTAGNLAKKTELISVLFELNKYSLIFEVSNMVQWYGYKIAGILELISIYRQAFLNFIGWKKFQNRGVVSVITSSQLNQRS
uniref:Uncharacterized protein n=1 Tax=Panagrellus redivivus TaxID=6233 RepID=A0A7E5A1B2_PANRE